MTLKKWRVSWHERDHYVPRQLNLKHRDFADIDDAVNWLHFAEDHLPHCLWPYIGNIEKDAVNICSKKTKKS